MTKKIEPKLTGAAKRNAAQTKMREKAAATASPPPDETKDEAAPPSAPPPDEAPPQEDEGLAKRKQAVANGSDELPGIDSGVPIIPSPGKTPTRMVTVNRDTVHILKFPDGHEYMLNTKEKVRSDLIVRTASGALVRLTQVDKPTKKQQKEQAEKEERAAWKKASRKSAMSSQSTSEGEDDTMASKKKSTKKTGSKKTGTAVPRTSSFSGKKLYKLVKENPRRPGSIGHKSWEKLTSGMTWEKAVEAGCRAGDLRWDIKHKHLEVRNA